MFHLFTNSRYSHTKLAEQGESPIRKLTVTEMDKLAGGTVAHLSIKILAHREGVQ